MCMLAFPGFRLTVLKISQLILYLLITFGLVTGQLDTSFDRTVICVIIRVCCSPAPVQLPLQAALLLFDILYLIGKLHEADFTGGGISECLWPDIKSDSAAAYGMQRFSGGRVDLDSGFTLQRKLGIPVVLLLSGFSDQADIFYPPVRQHIAFVLITRRELQRQIQAFPFDIGSAEHDLNAAALPGYGVATQRGEIAAPLVVDFLGFLIKQQLFKSGPNLRCDSMDSNTGANIIMKVLIVVFDI